MIKNIYIDGLFMALSYEAKKIFINKDDVIISFKKEDQEENKEILELIENLGIKEVIGDYSITLNFEFMTLEIHKGYEFRLLRNISIYDLKKLWTIVMVEIDQLMTKEAKE